MKRTSDTEIPKLQSLEEGKCLKEREVLVESKKGKIKKPKTDRKCSSLLIVRPTRGELAQMRDIAAQRGCFLF